ncbi:MAG: hypothetical protein HZA64_15565 [Rhodocyclales bacterium]|nr:hypothetical protein [Rhodocyclales bacterium]
MLKVNGGTCEAIPLSVALLVGAIVCPESEVCSNPRPYLHKANAPYQSQRDRFNGYLLSLELAPGTYTLQSLATVYVSLLSEAGGYVPLDMKFHVRPNTISYLGHIDVVLRERKTDAEARAGREQLNIGPVVRVEMKDASRTGYSTGAFDVVVEDKFDDDLPSFVAEYPALKKLKVDKAILTMRKRPE